MEFAAECSEGAGMEALLWPLASTVAVPDSIVVVRLASEPTARPCSSNVLIFMMVKEAVLLTVRFGVEKKEEPRVSGTSSIIYYGVRGEFVVFLSASTGEAIVVNMGLYLLIGKQRADVCCSACRKARAQHLHHWRILLAAWNKEVQGQFRQSNDCSSLSMREVLEYLKGRQNVRTWEVYH